MKKIGKLKARNSREIKASKIGIGFECLDRQMWDDTDKIYKLIGATGVKHARVQTGWSRCEKEKGVYDFAWLDRIVDKLLEQGIQPWFNVSYGNVHHTEAVEPDAVGWAPIYSEESQQAWVKFIEALIKHFSNKIDHYEIWNEPDIDCFWSKEPSNPRSYMKLVKLTAPVIRKLQPEAKIIGGAMAHGLHIGGMNFLKLCLEEGLVDHVDILSYHRYHIHAELNRESHIKATKELLKNYGGEHIKLWQAESGCPSVTSPTQALANVPVNEEVQAKVLLRNIMTDLSYNTDYTCYFHMSDFKFYYRNGYCEVPNYFGLVSFDNPVKVKPSYYAFQNLCAIFDETVELAPGTAIDIHHDSTQAAKYDWQEKAICTRIVSFKRDGEPLVAWWYPANLLNKKWEDIFMSMFISLPSNSKVDLDMVVIDPMTGDIFEANCQPKNERYGFEFSSVNDLPIKEYPLILTTKKAVNDLINSL